MARLQPPLAVLWDLDGTLLDANQSIRETMNAVLADQGMPGFTKPELDRLIGHPLRDILATRFATPPAPDLLDRMAHRYRAIYNESSWVTVRLYPGLEELIRTLRARGTRIGIVTSKGQAESEILMADLGVLDLFDAIVGDDDVRPLKPDPAPVAECCRRLGARPADATMVGDTRFDVAAGKAAGASTIGVLWGNGSAASLKEAGADALAADVKQLAWALQA